MHMYVHAVPRPGTLPTVCAALSLFTKPRLVHHRTKHNATCLGTLAHHHPPLTLAQVITNAAHDSICTLDIRGRSATEPFAGDG